MRFVHVNKADIPVSGRPTSKSAQLFKEFLESDSDVWKIELDDGEKTPESVRSSLDNYVSRHNLAVKVYTRMGQLFVEKSETTPAERKAAKAALAANANGVVTTGVEADVDEYAGI